MKQRFIVSILLLFFIAVWLISYVQKTPTAQDKPILSVAYLDIGQGDAILLTTPHKKHILVDGGPDGTILTRLGEEMPFFDHTFDLIVASHNHADHIAGLNKVIERYDVQKMWITGAIHTTNEYLRLLENIKENGIPTEVVWQGKSAEIDGVKLDVLHPIDNSEGLRPEDQHDATIVMRVTYGETHFLLTGDTDENHEQNIIHSGVELQSDVLKVPHHGSASGLALNFLNAVNPKYAVIQSGADNKYGHPAESILNKLWERGILIYRNDVNGTVTASSDGKTVQISPEK